MHILTTTCYHKKKYYVQTFLPENTKEVGTIYGCIKWKWQITNAFRVKMKSGQKWMINLVSYFPPRPVAKVCFVTVCNLLYNPWQYNVFLWNSSNETKEWNI